MDINEPLVSSSSEEKLDSIEDGVNQAKSELGSMESRLQELRQQQTRLHSESTSDDVTTHQRRDSSSSSSETRGIYDLAAASTEPTNIQEFVKEQHQSGSTVINSDDSDHFEDENLQDYGEDLRGELSSMQRVLEPQRYALSTADNSLSMSLTGEESLPTDVVPRSTPSVTQTVIDSSEKKRSEPEPGVTSGGDKRTVDEKEQFIERTEQQLEKQPASQFVSRTIQFARTSQSKNDAQLSSEVDPMGGTEQRTEDTLATGDSSLEALFANKGQDRVTDDTVDSVSQELRDKAQSETSASTTLKHREVITRVTSDPVKRAAILEQGQEVPEDFSDRVVHPDGRVSVLTIREEYVETEETTIIETITDEQALEDVRSEADQVKPKTHETTATGDTEIKTSESERDSGTTPMSDEEMNRLSLEMQKQTYVSSTERFMSSPLTVSVPLGKQSLTATPAVTQQGGQTEIQESEQKEGSNQPTDLSAREKSNEQIAVELRVLREQYPPTELDPASVKESTRYRTEIKLTTSSPQASSELTPEHSERAITEKTWETTFKKDDKVAEANKSGFAIYDYYRESLSKTREQDLKGEAIGGEMERKDSDYTQIVEVNEPTSSAETTRIRTVTIKLGDKKEPYKHIDFPEGKTLKEIEEGVTKEINSIRSDVLKRWQKLSIEVNSRLKGASEDDPTLTVSYEAERASVYRARSSADEPAQIARSLITSLRESEGEAAVHAGEGEDPETTSL
ncbi:hypothetical protein [Endozoicomonas elysicola]|uniref:hypothetical protein n=1 Tax=Endozoicomonas elysicola TaxID=305900 RepID=UPI00039A9351|nr:hypothetical protein [Endozoicomonas elysicola]